MVSQGAVVVDCSFAMPWVLQEEHSAAASGKLEVWELTGDRIIAPALFASEAASVLRKRTREGALTDPDAERALRDLLAAVKVVAADWDLAPRALAIATEVGAGRAYDSLYAALAECEGCELWTGDERFYNAAHPRYPWVRWVGEDRGPQPMR